ncbi:hypothetical protein KK083_22345 [Fulvivirgaceae bacterium PWU4]|uniref:Uncharacterized protein n=1 Tax=Chryseosolibacter histidini TaxID=2782349 RepID=A0AAP2DSG3_9BACT|nr:hypothetical protein [Chryseosolibacter histidini]MBT1699644.1 hypothetical protein [Chryseosolibacter histidini]
MSRKVSIREYITMPGNTLVREDFTTSYIINEIKLFAIIKQRRIKIYEQEIDIEGCDLIIEDDTDLARKFQLKSVIEGGKRKSFEIHSSILLPDIFRCSDYGFDNVICPRTMGGVIMLVIHPNEKEKKVSLTYRYTDFNVISYLANYKKQIPAIGLIKKLMSQDRKVDLPSSLFIPLSSAGSLLRIAGFFNECEFDYWCNQFNKLHYGRQQSRDREGEIQNLLGKMSTYIEGL